MFKALAKSCKACERPASLGTCHCICRIKVLAEEIHIDIAEMMAAFTYQKQRQWWIKKPVSLGIICTNCLGQLAYHIWSVNSISTRCLVIDTFQMGTATLKKKKKKLHKEVERLKQTVWEDKTLSRTIRQVEAAMQ